MVLFRLQGASGNILLMWDRRVVEKLDGCAGEFLVAISFRNVKGHFLGRLRVFMAQMPLVIEGFCG
jgi:hypothetical protein